MVTVMGGDTSCLSGGRSGCMLELSGFLWLVLYCFVKYCFFASEFGWTVPVSGRDSWWSIGYAVFIACAGFCVSKECKSSTSQIYFFTWNPL